MSERFVTLASFDTPTHAGLLQMRLEREGVPCSLVNETLHGATGLNYVTGEAGIRLQVRESDAERARAILAEETDAPDAADLERQAEASLRCPRCGSEEIEYVEAAQGFAGACAACGNRWELSEPTGTNPGL